MTGHRTSIYVPADLTGAAEAAKKAGRSLTDILRAGFAAEGFTDAPVTRAELAAELAPLLAAIQAQPATNGQRETPCPHPPGRRQKNGTYCGACGQNVA